MCPQSKLTMDALVSDAVVGNFEQLDADSVKIFRSTFGKQAVLADIFGDYADPLDIIIGEDYNDAIAIGHPVAYSGGLKATLTIFGRKLHGSGASLQSIPTLLVFWEPQYRNSWQNFGI